MFKASWEKYHEVPPNTGTRTVRRKKGEASPTVTPLTLQTLTQLFCPQCPESALFQEGRDHRQASRKKGCLGWCLLQDLGETERGEREAEKRRRVREGDIEKVGVK